MLRRLAPSRTEPSVGRNLANLRRGLGSRRPRGSPVESGAAHIHRHPVVLTPPLHRPAGIDLAPVSIEYQVHLIIASGAAWPSPM
jgi:hypothetical protein